VEFWFEFGSTYSYPAAMRVEAIAGAGGVEVEWRPFLLGPIFRAQGWNDSPFNLYPAKGRYMWRDLERVCAEDRIPFRRPTEFPRNGLLAARVACWCQTEPWLPEFVRRVYLANFAHDRDIEGPGVIASILQDLGRPSSLLSAATSHEAKERLREQSEQARRRGIFGAPSFVVEGELFWGNDRLETALAWARRRETRAV
jgi:2-hydroxychromene-2-carboxylate isomerase